MDETRELQIYEISREDFEKLGQVCTQSSF